MPFETYDRSPPPLFKQGVSALSRLVFFSALALLLMVADARFHLVQPLRVAVATVLYPAQWLARQPVRLVRETVGFVGDIKGARVREEQARRLLAQQSQRAAQADYLRLENESLRALLDLKPRLQAVAQAAQIIYDAPDPYSRRVVISKGSVQGVQPGAPVMDEGGVLGQVTRVYPMSSEVTLLTDKNQVAPVINARTGLRGVVYGSAQPRGATLELRYTSATEDVQEGDLLVTSGMDGVYPPGLPVARVQRVDRRGGGSAFAYIECVPQAHMGTVAHVMVLEPGTPQMPQEAASAPASAPQQARRAPGAASRAAAARSKR
ncbi:MAG: rod shape-determining protein MreC [Ottowia sp.]|nr:rod shape-determining protein MreC [Ottowia sp.]